MPSKSITKKRNKMKLLVITQVVNEEDQVLGFMVGWLAELARQTESLEVICLSKGRFTLPANVRVWSLGKETGESRLKYLVNFYKYVWTRRRDYDAVWIHMNQVYVILGWVVWKFFNKPISLWYAHGSVSWSLRLAEKLAYIIFTSAPKGFRLPSKKVKVVGQGIDLERFNNLQTVREVGLLVHAGRISRIKRQKELLESLALISNTPWRLIFYGGPVTADDEVYVEELKDLINNLGLNNRVTFAGPRPYSDLPKCLSEAELFVTMSQTGSLDKAVLDAMAAGTIPIIAGETFKQVLGDDGDLLLTSDQPEAFAQKVEEILSLSPQAKADLRARLQKIIAEQYSLPALMQKIVSNLTDVTSTH